MLGREVGMIAPCSNVDQTPTPFSCMRCPVCGSEECEALEELGMYCEVKASASQATRTDRPAHAPDGEPEPALAEALEILEEV